MKTSKKKTTGTLNSTTTTKKGATAVTRKRTAAKTGTSSTTQAVTDEGASAITPPGGASGTRSASSTTVTAGGGTTASPPSKLTPAWVTTYVDQVIAALDTFESQLGADPPLTPVEKRHSAKYRKGGAQVVTQVANLAVQNQLESPTLQTSTMTESLAIAQALMPLVNRLGQFGQHVGDLVFSSENAAWVTTLQFYALLKHLARTDTTLNAAIQPIVAQFAYRNPATKKGATQTKPQKKATAKAVKTLKQMAPTLLSTASSSAGQTPATTAGSPAPATPPATH